MMGNWRNQILRAFVLETSFLTIVSDPDGLILEEGILQEVRQKGFEILTFEDHVAFRFVYESKFRSLFDSGKRAGVAVVLRCPSSDLGAMPFDLLQVGRQLSFSLGELFPNLSYPVVGELDRADLDALYQAQEQHRPGVLGDNATKDFVLRHVFEIAPELIKSSADLLRVLLRRHYNQHRIPESLDRRFVEILRGTGFFTEWPLEQITASREYFFAFLQERWPLYVNSLCVAKQRGGHQLIEVSAPTIPGPLVIPFGHDDVRVYIDNLFTEGILKPISHPQADSLTREWVAIGLRSDPVGDYSHRFGRLLELIDDSVPEADCRHQDWLRFAYRWAELVALSVEGEIAPSAAMTEGFRNLREKLDSRFSNWVENRYSGLHNQPALPPVMVHHVVRAIARSLAETDERIVLLVVDGMSLDEWIVIRDTLATQRPRFEFDEHAVFAWIPTLTSVSRQAMFSGRPPMYFSESILTTDREESLWCQYWANEGLSSNQVAYIRGLGNGDLERAEAVLLRPGLRVAGLVVSKIDKIMHGIELGIAGLHNQVRQWTNQGYLTALLDLAHKQGFSVFLSSDHGNIEAVGCGRPNEGSTADVRGERVRIFPNTSLRQRVKRDFPQAVEWPCHGLPDDFCPLIAPHREAFVASGSSIVSHGGATIEEVIVPFVQIRQKAI